MKTLVVFSVTFKDAPEDVLFDFGEMVEKFISDNNLVATVLAEEDEVDD